MDTSLCKLQEIVKGREAWCAAGHDVTGSDTTERLNKSTPPLERESYQTWVAGGNLNPGAGTSVFYVNFSLFYYWFALFFDGTF